MRRWDQPLCCLPYSIWFTMNSTVSVFFFVRLGQQPADLEGLFERRQFLLELPLLALGRLLLGVARERRASAFLRVQRVDHRRQGTSFPLVVGLAADPHPGRRRSRAQLAAAHLQDQLGPLACLRL